ncbi:MAG: acyl-CoA dehydrogenase [Pseudomonadota bacterium]
MAQEKIQEGTPDRVSLFDSITDDIDFLLYEVLGAEQVLSECGLPNPPSREDARLITSMIARFCKERIEPVALAMGEEGCKLLGESVSTPYPMRDIYCDFSRDGWLSMTAEVEHNGQGLPKIFHFALMELLGTSCLAFQDYIGTFCSTYEMVRSYGDQRVRELYLPGLATGEIGGTQCMTEPHCGTDLSLINSRAEPQDDGSYRLTGSKIFISGGDQDLTKNIVHIVLARAPGDGDGNRGLSLFLAPKYMPGESGDTGLRNSVYCTRLENKMGYAAQATCQLSFEGATGWLMGERGRGLSAMFTMVNEARLSVGCQGFSAASAAYQKANRYARERLQGRRAGVRGNSGAPADPILGHPDVRRLLMKSGAFIQSARAAYYWLALESEAAASHCNSDRRKRAGDIVSLLTGVFKAMGSDYGYQSCNDAMQIFGGHGYIRETGIEHYVRDCRVAQIYEGANGMLAADVLTRFVLNERSASFSSYLDLLTEEMNRARKVGLEDLASDLENAVEALVTATAKLKVRAAADIEEVGAAAMDYQHCFALILMAHMWLKIMCAVQARSATSQSFAARHTAKMRAGRYFFEKMLPASAFYAEAVTAGSQALLSIPLAEV